MPVIATIREDRIIVDMVGPGAALAMGAASEARDTLATVQVERGAVEIAAAAIGTYPDTATGLASTTHGQYFYAVSAGTIKLYRNQAGTPQEQAELITPSSSALNARPTSAQLSANDGATRVGYDQGGAGAVPVDVKTILDQTIYAIAFGVKADGSDETAKLQAAINRAAGGTLILPPGTIVSSRLSISSNTKIIGAGIGNTILKLKDGANQYFIVNSNTSAGNRGIWLEGFTVDGNYLHQTLTASGVVFDKVTASHLDIEARNCFGTGAVISAGGWNTFGANMWCRGNGKTTAGYGLYIYCSDGNVIVGGRYDDNCIGIAIEASGVGQHSNYNRVINSHFEGNRAEFDHSGAGIHFEASSGGNCDYCEVLGGMIANGTGVGINNTGCSVKVTGTTIKGNAGAGVSTLAATQVHYSGLKLIDNGAGAGAGYRSEIIFDAPGYASDGVVDNCYLRGTYALDGAIRTTQSGSSIKFINNDVAGYITPSVISGVGDILVREEKGSFTASLSGGSAAITAICNWRISGDEAVLSFPAGLVGPSGSASARISGAPTKLYPIHDQIKPAIVTNNGASVFGSARVATNAQIDLGVGATVDGFSASGNKGLPAGAEIRFRLS